MAIVTKPITRVFTYSGLELPDIPSQSAQQVRDTHAAMYPELLSAEIFTGAIVNGVQTIEFRRTVGTKA